MQSLQIYENNTKITKIIFKFAKFVKFLKIKHDVCTFYINILRLLIDLIKFKNINFIADKLFKLF